MDWPAELLSDLRYAIRRLAASPAFTAVAVGTLALGIGANSALFSVLHGVLLRPLPYERPEEVVRIQAGWQGSFGNWLSQPEIVDLEEGVSSLEGVAAFTPGSVNLTGDGEPERLRSAQVMPELFEVLGVEARRGRTFTAAEGVPGGDGVVLLSHGLFQRRFGADPDVVGRTIEVNGVGRSVVGVLSPDFRLPTDFQGGRTEIVLPLVLDRDSLQSRGSHYLHTVARLGPGATPDAVQEELDALSARLTEEGLYAANRNFGFSAVPIRDDVFGDVRTALLVLLGAVTFVLLIACVNVANLLLARGEERHREVAVRAALGAGRRRIAQALLAESVLISLLGGAVGLLVAFGGTRLLVALDPAGIPRVQEIGVDGPVLAFSFVVAVATGLLFGAAPVVQALGTDVQAGLKEGGRGGSVGVGRSRFRRALVVAQLALAVVLLTGAGLMIRTVGQLRAIDPGFRPEGVLTMRLSLPSSSYPDAGDVSSFYLRLVERAEAMPEVRSAAAVRALPLTGTIGDWSIDLADREEAPGENPHGDWQVVTPGYIEAMGVRLIRGRSLEERDRADAVPVVVINRTMAEEYWPGENPIGERFGLGRPGLEPFFQVVGVVEDVRHNALTEAPRTEMYMPHAQFGAITEFPPRSMTLVARTGGDPLGLAGPLRELVREMDPRLPVSDVRPMAAVVGDALADSRFVMTLLAVFAALALLLAAVGIYGVLAYAVSARGREIGIRLALGAGRGGVTRLVVSQGMVLAAGGLVVGVVVAAAGSRLMEGLLYGVEALDPVTFVVVPLVLGGVALVATLLPARRAASVDPMTALREE